MAMAYHRPMAERIHTQQDIEQGLTALRTLDPSLGPLIDSVPHVPLRLRQPGFEGLAEIVVGQLVSRASADAILKRLNERVAPLTADAFLTVAGVDMEQAFTTTLKGVGLSRAKIKTLLHAAQAIASGALDLDHIATLSVEEARSNLIALPGIGPWTADIYLLFCAGHADIFPVGDVALYAALGDHLGLEGKCPPKLATTTTQRWQPWRGVAARLFYARYAQMKGRTILPVS
ncbi:MAG: DNA-3-methyladenine glycosylase 2 family protein [Pseudomonadota bacterium]